MCLAGLVYLLPCKASYAEFIKGDSSDSYYICNYEKLASQSSNSKEIALAKARLGAIEEFINFAVAKNMSLPTSFNPYLDKIGKAVEFSFSSIKIDGFKVLKSLILKDGRAVCVVEIPKYNLKNFAVLDFSKEPFKLIEHIKHSKTLSFELSLILDKTDFTDFFVEGRPLSCAIENKPISSITKAWLAPKKINEADLKKVKDDNLLYLLDIYFGIDENVNLILQEMKSRAFLESFKFLKAQQISQNELNIEPLDFKTEIAFLEILQSNNFKIDFINSSSKNEKFEQAQVEFNSSNPDLLKLRNLLLESFLESISDSAMNLLGRAFEEDSMLKEAIIAYTQSLIMNENQPYAKYNLANSYYKLSMKDEAIAWANKTLEDESSSAWAKESASELLALITEANP